MSRPAVTDVAQVNVDGTAQLRDGRLIQLVVSSHGVLGCRLLDDGVTPVRGEPLVGVDQVGSSPVPTLRSAGLDQVG